MKREILTARLVRVEVVVCDRCGEQWTEDVCRRRGWMLGPGGDYCERCRKAKGAANGSR